MLELLRLPPRSPLRYFVFRTLYFCPRKTFKNRFIEKKKLQKFVLKIPLGQKMAKNGQKRPCFP